MAVDLAKNEFWLKKIRKECEVRDANKDGLISRADFEVIVQRYKDMGTSDQHMKTLANAYAKISGLLGLEDPNTKLTFEEAMSNFAGCSDKFDAFMEIFDAQFTIIDSSEDGIISFKEWVDIYKAAGIDTAHAKASFESMDTNADGVVSKDEFLAFNKEFYFTAEDKLHSSIMYGPLD